MSFEEAYELGLGFEVFCLKDINEKKYPLAYKNEIKKELSYYDIVLFDNKFSEKPKTIECKFDEMGKITGNVCIETACNGILSGLLVTTADYWIISDGTITYLIKTENIGKCLLENEKTIRYEPKSRVKQKDGEVKIMSLYLIPKRIFEKYCLEISAPNNMTYKYLI